MRTLFLLLWLSGSVTAFRRAFAGLFSEAAPMATATTTLSGSDVAGVQQKQRQHQEGDESSWLDGMEFEDTYPEKQPPVNEDDDDSPAESALDYLQLHPLLQVPLAISLASSSSSSSNSCSSDDEKSGCKPVRTYCDTGAQRTVMSWDCAQQLGLLQHLDRRYAGKATGVGSCRVLGRIPAGICQFHFHGGSSDQSSGAGVTVKSPPITIIESAGTPGVELLLGLDFLREYQAVLSLGEEDLALFVKGKVYRIPFLRPRGGSTPRSETSSSCRSARDCTSIEEDAGWSEDEENNEYDGLDFSGV
jgi:Aspartyl protease